MKKILLPAIIIFCSVQFVHAQWITTGNNINNTNTGNVGIGTTTPANTLDVNGIGNFGAGVKVGSSGGAVDGKTLIQFTSYDSHFGNNYIQGGGYLYLLTNTFTNGGGYAVPSNTSNSSWRVSMGGCSACGSLNDNFIISRAPATTGIPAFTNLLTVNGLGYVGIDNMTPSYNLDITGTFRATGNITVPTVNNEYIGQGPNNSSFVVGAGLNGANNTGYANFAIGGPIMYAANMTGFCNVGVGGPIMSSLTGGYYNAAVGDNVMMSNTTGNQNVAMGHAALYSNTTGYGSVAVGVAALATATGTGTFNTAVGFHAGDGMTTGYGSTFLGFYTGVHVSGSNNTILGGSGSFNTLGLTTGAGNTIIGANISGLSPTLTNHIILADGLGNQRFIIDDAGNAGIGTSTPDAKLTVNGTVHAKEVKVNTNILPDYVFDKEYNLASLKNVKAYIDKNHHLPEIPSAQQVAKDGLNLGEMNTRLLKKIEELTLYLIEKDTELKKQKTLLADQQKQLDEIKKKLNLN